MHPWPLLMASCAFRLAPWPLHRQRHRIPGCLTPQHVSQLGVVALQALSDPEKRKIYDQFGEEGLKQGPPPPGAGGFDANGFGGFPGGGSGGGGHYRYQPRSANDIFAEVN